MFELRNKMHILAFNESKSYKRKEINKNKNKTSKTIDRSSGGQVR